MRVFEAISHLLRVVAEEAQGPLDEPFVLEVRVSGAGRKRAAVHERDAHLVPAELLPGAVVDALPPVRNVHRDPVLADPDLGGGPRGPRPVGRAGARGAHGPLGTARRGEARGRDERLEEREVRGAPEEREDEDTPPRERDDLAALVLHRPLADPVVRPVPGRVRDRRGLRLADLRGIGGFERLRREAELRERLLGRVRSRVEGRLGDRDARRGHGVAREGDALPAALGMALARERRGRRREDDGLVAPEEGLGRREGDRRLVRRRRSAGTGAIL